MGIFDKLRNKNCKKQEKQQHIERELHCRQGHENQHSFDSDLARVGTPYRSEDHITLEPGSPYVPDQNDRFIPRAPHMQQAPSSFKDELEEVFRLSQAEIEGIKEAHEEPQEEDGPGPNPWRRRITYVVLLLAFFFILLKVVPIPFGKVEVTGDTGITAYELVQTDVIESPVNIFQINRDRLENYLKHDLRVETVNMKYGFPATLEIHLEKRKTVAVVMTQFGYGEVDKDNQCIQLSSTVPSGNGPIISGVKLGNLLLGDTIDDSKIKGGIEYLKYLTPEERKNISEVNVGDSKNITAYTVDGLKMYLGNTDGMTEKSKLSMQMLKDVRNKNMNIEYMDVNVDAPLFKLQK